MVWNQCEPWIWTPSAASHDYHRIVHISICWQFSFFQACNHINSKKKKGFSFCNYWRFIATLMRVREQVGKYHPFPVRPFVWLRSSNRGLHVIFEGLSLPIDYWYFPQPKFNATVNVAKDVLYTLCVQWGRKNGEFYFWWAASATTSPIATKIYKGTVRPKISDPSLLYRTYLNLGVSICLSRETVF